MSDSNRRDDYPIVAATLVGFLVIFGMIGYYVGIHEGRSGRGEIYAKAHHEDAKREIERACLSRTGTDLADCIQAAVKTSGEYQRAEYDLTAQQEMSDWARWLLIISLMATGITLLGVVYVWKTLVATQDGVAETRRIGEAQLRAYVVPEKCVLDYEDGRPIATVTFRNSGGSPADNIAVAASLTLNRGPVAIFMVVRRDELLPKAALGPNGETIVMVALPTKMSIEGLNDGLLHVIVGGSVEYTDIFRRKWRRSFIFNAVPANGGKPNLGEISPGNKYLPERFVGVENEPSEYD